MAGYKPIKIAGFTTGLIQEREDFLLVEDGFPILENAYVWREKIIKKEGKFLVGRLRRVLAAETDDIAGDPMSFTAAGTGSQTMEIFTVYGVDSLEPDASVQKGSSAANLVISLDPGGGNETILTDTNGDGDFVVTGAGPIISGTPTINYSTGIITATFTSNPAVTVSLTMGYYPGLPAMGIRLKELNNINIEDTLIWDTRYVYILSSSQFVEYTPLTDTRWTGSNSQFMWTTNYWVDDNNNKLLWATNFKTGTNGDPIRYTNGSTWTDFEPVLADPDDPPNKEQLWQCRMLRPFRGRLLAFDTEEGKTAAGRAGSVRYRQRVRWSQIGSPVNDNSWLYDVRGKGSFIDIPTAQSIIGSEFIHDRMIIFCERSTWELRYTGRSIQPFDVVKINTELGSESTFSTVASDEDVKAVGDKRIIICDGYKAVPMDIKIPDLAMSIENANNGPTRVHGLRDIPKRLIYWTYPDDTADQFQGTFPNKRLVYNYENEAWAIFKDSITVMGTRWLGTDVTWEDVGDQTWEEYSGTWASLQQSQPVISGGNQHGYVHDLDQPGGNDPSLFIKAITVTAGIPTFTVPNHNLASGDFVEVTDILGDYSDINGTVYRVIPTSINAITLEVLTGGEFITLTHADVTYKGCGQLTVRDNFRIRSKKFDHMDQGQKIQVGYMDTLWTRTTSGQVTWKVYTDYLNVEVNDGEDTFFNNVIETFENEFDTTGTDRVWRRAICPNRASFVQVEWTLSDEQMVTSASNSAVILHAMLVWERAAGRITM